MADRPVISVAGTEPQARRFMERLKEQREAKRKKKNDKSGLRGQGDVTGTSPAGIQKSKKQGEAELRALREKQKQRRKNS